MLASGSLDVQTPSAWSALHTARSTSSSILVGVVAVEPRLVPRACHWTQKMMSQIVKVEATFCSRIRGKSVRLE